MTRPTDQQAFDTVVRHLRAQGRRSVSIKQTCLYRSPNGARCAVGVLIPDDRYSIKMEGTDARDLAEIFPEIADCLPDNTSLLDSLQRAHDNSSNWHVERSPGHLHNGMRHELISIAATYELSAAVLDETP